MAKQIALLLTPRSEWPDQRKLREEWLLSLPKWEMVRFSFADCWSDPLPIDTAQLLFPVDALREASEKRGLLLQSRVL